ncbi:hypothetical protein DL93DRAFT_2043994, partial [Clavulina sp. PMI_390]
CLPGTRTEILDAIIQWATGYDLPANIPSYLQQLDQDKRIAWLCGVAGSGKSSIAMSVALAAHASGLLGAYYRFSTANQAQLNPSTLFSTIACQLASQNKKTEEQLVSIVKKCDQLTQQSTNPSQQLSTFVLPILGTAPSPHHTHTLIIIDAVDESGNMGKRQELLKCL